MSTLSILGATQNDISLELTCSNKENNQIKVVYVFHLGGLLCRPKNEVRTMLAMF